MWGASRDHCRVQTLPTNTKIQNSNNKKIICKVYWSKLQNVFVWIIKYICSGFIVEAAETTAEPSNEHYQSSRYKQLSNFKENEDEIFIIFVFQIFYNDNKDITICFCSNAFYNFYFCLDVYFNFWCTAGFYWHCIFSLQVFVSVNISPIPKKTWYHSEKKLNFFGGESVVYFRYNVNVVFF